MSTLYAEGSALYSAVRYLAERSHNPEASAERNVMTVSNYGDIMRFIEESERRINKAKGIRNDLYSVRLSFSREEFDPKSPEDQWLALQLSKKVTESWLEDKGVNRPYLIALQRDGQSGLLHSHIYICNPGIDGKPIPKGVSALQMQDLNDKVTREFMLDHDRSTAVQDTLIKNKASHDHHSMGAATDEHMYGKSVDNAKAKDNRKYMTDTLKKGLNEATSRDAFIRFIQLQGIYLNRRANKEADDLWLRKDGTFRKSLSIEYKGTKARTATLLGMDLNEINQRLQVNQSREQNKLHENQVYGRQNQNQVSASNQSEDAHQPVKHLKTITTKLPKLNQSKKQSKKAPLAKPYINQKQLLNKKYQQLIDINQKLSLEKILPKKKEILIQHRDELSRQVVDLESAVYVGETQRTIQRQRRLEQQQERDSELES